MAHELGELAPAPTLANLHPSPAPKGFEGHEEVGHASPLVLVVVALWMARSEAKRLAEISKELAGALLEAD